MCLTHSKIIDNSPKTEGDFALRIFKKPSVYNKIKEPPNIVFGTMQRPTRIFCSVKASMGYKVE